MGLWIREFFDKLPRLATVRRLASAALVAVVGRDVGAAIEPGGCCSVRNASTASYNCNQGGGRQSRQACEARQLVKAFPNP